MSTHHITHSSNTGNNVQNLWLHLQYNKNVEEEYNLVVNGMYAGRNL